MNRERRLIIIISLFHYRKQHRKSVIVIVDRAGKRKLKGKDFFIIFLLLLVQVHRKRNVEGQGLFNQRYEVFIVIFIFRLYERDPFTNKPIKSDVPSSEITMPNTTLLLPGHVTSYSPLPIQTNGCNSLIYPNQNVRLQYPIELL